MIEFPSPVNLVRLSKQRLSGSLMLSFLTGFLFDLPWISQSIISFVLVAASFIVGDFIDALVALWQATAVASLIFLMANYILKGEVSALYSALLILPMWLVLLLVHRDKSESVVVENSIKISAEIVGCFTLLMLYWIVPKGRLENFGLLKGEDNERWLISIVNVLRGGGLRLVSSFDSYEIQYFTKFFLNGVTYLDPHRFSLGDKSSVLSLNVLSNAYVLLLISCVFLTIKICLQIFNYLGIKSSSFLFIIVIAVQSSLFFRASQFVGHFPQFLLNCVVLIFVISIIQLASTKQKLIKLILILICTALAWAMVGSYNPWIPISLVSLLLVFNASWENSPIRRLLKSKMLPVLLIVQIVAGIFAFRVLSGRYSGLDDSGGVWTVPLEAVWLVSLLILVSFAQSVIRIKWKARPKAPQIFKINTLLDNLVWLFSMVVIVGLVFFDFSFNQSTTVCFVLLLGSLFNRSSYNRIQRNVSALFRSQILDGVVLLALASLGYALVIYAMSRFTGPLYEPRYAANKSMLAVFGQFAWLPLILFVVDFEENLGLVRKIKLAGIFGSFLVVIGLTPFLKYTEVGEAWWYQSAIEAITDKPDAIVVCVDPDWRTINYEIYTCNRFMQTLTKIEYPSSGARYLAWHQPEEYDKITLYFNKTGPKRQVPYRDDMQVVVLAQSKPTVETMKMFAGVPTAMLDLRVASENKGLANG